MEETKLNLYHHPLSPFAMIAKAVVSYLNIEHTEVNVDLSVKENRREWYLKINPNGTIPAIKDGDFCLSETLAL